MKDKSIAIVLRIGAVYNTRLALRKGVDHRYLVRYCGSESLETTLCHATGTKKADGI